jgi:pimeloyl-ACP methyl ester carboxylesterase
MTPATQRVAARIVFTDIDADIRLRSLVVDNDDPEGVVLFLHGFPETAYAWKDIAQALGEDYEVHAFDWPGYGQSTRPSLDRFSYAPREYARILGDYIRKAGIDTSRLVIYATDIGALPALLLAIEEPEIARSIVVGNFAPFNRSEYMVASLQGLKCLPGAEGIRAYMNKTRDEILAKTHRRGFARHEQFEIPSELEEDMRRGWDEGDLTSVDAFCQYYLQFTRDQDHLESHLGRLKTRVRAIWGDRDIFIDKRMGIEFAQKTGAPLDVLAGVGHFPHLQDPAQTVNEVRREFARLA